MRRVVVVGGPGSGKTTLARRLAEQIGADHVELDELWWDAGWTPAGADQFVARTITRLEATQCWVVDGNYLDEVGHVIWPMADTVVWLDARRPIAVGRAVVRSARRVARREELWNGNREPLANLGPASLLGLWRRWPTYGRQIEEMLDTPAHAHLDVVRRRR